MSLIRSFMRQRGKDRKPIPTRNRVLFEALEPRLLLDGTGLDPDPITNPVTLGVGYDNGAIELVVDLSAETNALIGELNENSLSGLGLASPIPCNNVDILTIILGSGADHLTISGTSADTRVIAGPGDDNITIRGSGSRTTISGGEGDDTLTLIIDDLGGLSSSSFIDLAFTIETLRLEHTGTSPVNWRVEDGSIFAGNFLIVDTLGADAVSIIGNGSGDTLTMLENVSDSQLVTISADTVEVEHGVSVLEFGGYLDEPSESYAATLSPDGKYLYTLNESISGIDVFRWSPSTGNLAHSVAIGREWMAGPKLTASDRAPWDYAGSAISVSGARAIIGAYADDDKGYDSGSAYIFQEVSGAWQQVAKLRASDGAPWDSFGASVSISGDRAIVGAYGDDDKGASSGSAYIFQEVSPGTWQQVAKLMASDGAAQDAYGASVAVSGDTAIIGAYGDDNSSGSAYLFQYKDRIANAESMTLSPDGTHLYVASPDDDALSVFVRNESNGGLTFLQELRDPVNLASVDFITFSPDGGRAYAATDLGVSVFSRDAVSGALTFLTKLTDSALGRPVAITTAGEYVYVAGDGDLLRSYHASGTELVQIGVDLDVSNPSVVAPSPDGENLYIARKADDAISIFARDPATGMLTYIEEVTNGVRGVRGLDGASSLVVTDDYVFATGENNDSLVAFKRDNEGRLSFTQRLKNGSGSVQRLENPNSIAISPDGQWVYVGSGGEGTVAGGVAWFGILPTPQPAPPLILGYSGIGELTVRTSGGDDTVSIHNTDIPVTVETGEGTDTINVWFLGQAVMTVIDAGSGDDVIHIAGGELKAGSWVDLKGGPGEDTLFFEPDGNPITPQVPGPHSGDVKVFGSEFGTVHYHNVENIPGFQAAVANAGTIPTSIYEGNSLTLMASAVPATNREILSFVWDLNGDGDFGDVLVTDLQFDGSTNTYSATTTVPWADLFNFGLDDGDVPDGTTYEIGLRALDNIGDFAEDTVGFTLNNTAPVVDLMGDTSVIEGMPYLLTLVIAHK